MVNKTTKLRWRRRLRRSRYQVENLSVQAEQGIEQHFFKRLGRLGSVRRFAFGWVMLVMLLGLGVLLQVRALSPYYQTIQPANGGIYTEGILGTFTTANPLYASGPVDGSVSKLLFAAPMKYSADNRLITDLAQELKTDDRSIEYTLTLKDDLRWHDGKRVTADDVIFTYQLIQNPDAKSSLRANWVGIKMEKADEKSVKFTLPHPLSSFPTLLTTGLIPKHLLDSTTPSQLRTALFNTTSPVGTGPFKWDSIQISGQTPEAREEQIGLSANEHYHAGRPSLDRIIVKGIHTHDSLIRQFNNQEIDAMVGLDKLPDSVKADTSISQYEMPINAQVMVFFKSSSEILKDKIIRQALTKGTNRAEIIKALGYGVIPVNGPLLKSHLGYAADTTQFAYNLDEANDLLEQNGWVKNVDGMRAKNETPLTVQLYSQNNGEYALVTQILQRQWRDLGVKVEVVLQEDTDLQNTLALHGYDALLYGITVGSDPDVFAYWHSSQADLRASSRLNFSEFKSSTADSALEGGRTRSDDAIRAPKYKPFLAAWREEAPAIGLYQPRFLYVTRGTLYGFNSKVVNTVTDRYTNVQNWRIRTERVTIE